MDLTSLPITQRLQGQLTHYGFHFSEKVTSTTVGPSGERVPTHAEESCPPFPLNSEYTVRFLQTLLEGGTRTLMEPPGEGCGEDDKSTTPWGHG